MNKRKKSCLCVAVVGVLFPAIADVAVASKSHFKRLAEEARRVVVIERRCETGTPIELELRQGQAARLDAVHLQIGLKEVLIRPTEKNMYLCCVWEDGGLSTNARPLEPPICTWVPREPIGFRIEWKTQNGVFVVRLAAYTDEQQVQTIIREKRKEAEKHLNRIMTDHERIVGFVKLWSEVKYNFAFFDQVPKLDWDAVLEEYLPRVQKEQTVGEYYRLLQECIAKLNDGHTSAWGPRLNSFAPALLIQPIEGKACIVAVGNNKELANSGLKRGDVITHVDGRSVEQVLKEDLYPITFASTPQGRDGNAYARLLEGPIDSQVKLRVSRLEGSTREVTLTRFSTSIDKPWTNRPILEYCEPADGITYVALNSFGSKDIVTQFEERFEKIKNAKGLILDVRENSGGNSGNGDAIVSRLTDKPLAGTCWKTRQYRPAFRAWGKNQEWYKGGTNVVNPRGKDPFLGPVVVLIGPDTASAAEDFLIPLHTSRRATLVGERTSGSTGQPLFIDLPAGGGARICTKWDTYPDGREFIGVGIIPDIEVHPTVEDIAAGRDVILQTGLQVLQSRLAEK